MLRRISIGSHERAFLYKNADYLRYLRPGVHWVWGWNRPVVRASTRALELSAPDLEVYLQDAECWEDLAVADLADDERALLWIDGRIQRVVGPGRSAFWKDLHDVKLESFDASAELRLKHPLLDAILAVDAGEHLQEVTVPQGQRGLLYVNEELREELRPGRYAFWRDVARVRCQLVDLREQALDVTGQEILTADKVSLRVNLIASFRVTDAKVAVETAPDLRMAVYRELQLALRESVGARKLDALLSDKDEVAREVAASAEPRVHALGAALGSVGMKDLILPGEMKTLLNQVIEAEKRAQANLIARREETAATRSLLNTAKLIESSPTLLRLKELEAAERMAQSIGSIQIAGGGLDGLIRQLLPGQREA
jgi:regulator of protease activity HflC (stomatin/prohibitin superfamily)